MSFIRLIIAIPFLVIGKVFTAIGEFIAGDLNDGGYYNQGGARPKP